MSTSDAPLDPTDRPAVDPADDHPGTGAPADDEGLTDERRRELLAGGDASRAPQSLSATELHPIEGASSGTSWDDPDEL